MITLKKLKDYYNWGGRFLTDPEQQKGSQWNAQEVEKSPFRYDIINKLLETRTAPNYLEIGVRDPSLNFDKICAEIKYSVDPGLEFAANPVDFKVTSDVFFDQMRKGEILQPNVLFDVIFIDGLHLAEQVDRDIKNSFDFLKDDGFIVLHDCNPPSEWHARETHAYRLSPAGNNWNGTTWKAFVKWGQNPDIRIACVDTDWGVGILTKGHTFERSKGQINAFYEFSHFDANKSALINLMSHDRFLSFI